MIPVYDEVGLRKTEWTPLKICSCIYQSAGLLCIGLYMCNDFKNIADIAVEDPDSKTDYFYDSDSDDTSTWGLT